MENIKLQKTNGTITVSKIISKKLKEEPAVSMEVTRFPKGEKQNVTHMCWGNRDGSGVCKHACALECQKVGDERKKSIDKYDFITDGYQTIKANGKLDKFIVTGCKNYEASPEKKLTAEDKARINAAKRAIRTLYFGTNSNDEALIKQYMQQVRGTITKAGKKKLPEDAIIAKIEVRDDAEQLFEEMFIYKVKELVSSYYILLRALRNIYGTRKMDELIRDNKLNIAEATELFTKSKNFVKEISDKAMELPEESIKRMEDLKLCKHLTSEIKQVQKVKDSYDTKKFQREEKERKEQQIIDALIAKGIRENKIVK